METSKRSHAIDFVWSKASWEDMAKYATPAETTRIMAAFASIPSQLTKENKKFQYKSIKPGARAYDYELPIDWLTAAGVIIKTNKVTEGKMPLNIFSETSSFKIYMTDVGLLSVKFGVPANIILSQGNGYENFKGALAANYVAGALKMSGQNAF